MKFLRQLAGNTLRDHKKIRNKRKTKYIQFKRTSNSL